MALVSVHGRVLACRVGTITTHILPGGGAEQDPEEWWTAVKTTSCQLLADHPHAVANIKGIGCTSQWSGTVAVDGNGHHLMNAIIWMDSRGAPYAQAITLHWLTDNRDIDHIHYDPTLLQYTTMDRDKLPDLKRSVDILGPLQAEAAQELGLPPHIPVIMGTPDIQSAAIGSGAVRDYEPHLYIGTSSWLTCHVPFKKTDLFHNMASLPSAIPGKYFIANEQETAGACLTFLRNNILNANDALACDPPVGDMYAVFDEMVAQAPVGSEKVIFTPWLHGERTPVEDHLVRAGFYNLSLRTTRAHLIRAVFEGVAYNSRWLLRYVEKFAKRPLNNIHMIGGGANSAIWWQICARP